MSTLGQLKTSVDAWLTRDDVAVSGADFPQILLLSESDIARDVRAVVQEQSITLNFTGRSADLPYDYIGLRNIFIDDNVRKSEYRTPEAIRESSAWDNGRVGSFYSIEGGSQTPGDERTAIIIAGAATAPPDDLDMLVLYWARFAPLVNDPDTNWLLAQHYDVYLYSTLRAACEYIQEDILEDRYAGKYDRAVHKMSTHENRKRYGAFPKQSYGSPRAVI
jgi:hypothetical protein